MDHHRITLIGERIDDMERNKPEVKGLYHHPQTPPKDKAFYIQKKDRAIVLLRMGERFLADDVAEHRSISCLRAEFGANSRNLHRGVYCPSPVLDILVRNAKRGKILLRPTERSNITNRYVYDGTGRLSFIDNYLDGKMVSSEYLLYDENIVYGITIGMSGRIVCISEEHYSNSRIESYLCAYYSPDGENVRCHHMVCENYQYDECGFAYWDHYQIYFEWAQAGVDGLIQHKRYRFWREDGWLKAYTRVNIDGTPIDGSIMNEIKVKRKA